MGADLIEEREVVVVLLGVPLVFLVALFDGLVAPAEGWYKQPAVSGEWMGLVSDQLVASYLLQVLDVVFFLVEWLHFEASLYMLILPLFLIDFLQSF